MADAACRLLDLKPQGIYVDATLGTGGHAARILETAGRGVSVIGIDRDPAALETAGRALASFGGRVTLVMGNFRDLSGLVRLQACDGILADLGISSLQLSDGTRGFSYLNDGPLDMAMGPDGRSVKSLLQAATERDIAYILRHYGEVGPCRRVARAILEERRRAPLETTGRLRAAAQRTLPQAHLMQSLSKIFQAFRIWANEELDSLEGFLPQAVSLLRPGGRLVVISYHSLEDRMVKHFFRREAKGCTCPPEFPECRCGGVRRLAVVTKRPVRPLPEEVEENPRSRSARLRAAERL